jgi:CHAD domain-containing protein
MPTEESVEVERKYDVAPGVGDVPDLSALPGVARVAPPEELDQTATYVDTAELALVAARVTLRRRTGGVDDGWHLKLPLGDGGRREVHAPIADPANPDELVPAELVRLVRGLVRDRELAPVVVLRTHRRVHRLLGPDDRVLAELCDDRVEARTIDGGEAQRWREWELELVDGPAELLEQAEPVLVGAGAQRSASASKLGRALAGSRPPGSSWRARVAAPVGDDAAVTEVLSAYLAQHLDDLLVEDRRLRAGDREGVHRLRIAARRLRAALATYARVLEPGETQALRDELRWLGGVLAPARDAQVLRERLLEAVAGQPDVLVLGPVAQRVDDELRRAFRSGREAVDRELDGERYFRLLDRLEAFLDDPPVPADAEDGARRVLPELLRHDVKRVRKRHRAYLAATTPDGRDAALHEVRKAAKRLRYASESAVPVLGRRAAKLAARAKAVQKALGEHQDSVVARRVLRDLGVRAHLSGENGFTFGRLHGLEEARAGEPVARYLEAYGDLPTPSKVRSWGRG